MMGRKPGYEELEQRIGELEGEADKRKQALRDSEAWLKLLSEVSFEPIFLSKKGICLYQNKAAERMFSYTHTEAVGRNGNEWIIAEHRERVKDNMLSRYEKPYEVTALHKDGTPFTCEIQSRMINYQGRSIQITALRDITEPKKMLAEKTILLDNILKNAQDVGIATTDLGFRINYYNPMAEKLYGYTAEEVLGKTVQEMHTKEKVEPERFERAIEIVRREGRFCYSGTKVTGDGPRYLDSRVAGIFDPDGKMVGFSLFSRDVTERKQAEEALLAEHARFIAVMDSLDAALCVVDMETHKLIFVNKYVMNKFGDVVGKTCWKTIQTGQTGPCNFCTNDKLLDADGKPADPYVWEFRNTIDREWYQCRDQAILWPDGRLVRLEIATNITQHKQTEAALRQRESYLTGLNEAAQVLLVPTDTVLFQEFVDKIGPALDASRSYVFINHHDQDGSLLISQKAEWCAEGINPEIDNAQLQGLSYEVWLPRWKDILEHGDIINGLVSDFPAEERMILEPQGILAILIIPIMVDEEFVGFIGFDNCVSEREWGTIAQTFLNTAVSYLAQAIKRVRSEERVLASLREKELLLREIHHRVKNNMQVIVSLLRMHSRRTDDARLGQVFDDCRDRVNAMSFIHEALYQSKNLAEIDFEVYLKKLCRNLIQAYGASNKGIEVKVNPCNVALNMDQGIAVGMVICELVSNVFKHAFPPGKGGRLSINLSSLKGEVIELIVQDDGKGLPPEIDILNPPSLGLRLVSAAVTRELGGSIKVERDGGTRFIIHFKCKSK